MFIWWQDKVGDRKYRIGLTESGALNVECYTEGRWRFVGSPHRESLLTMAVIAKAQAEEADQLEMAREYERDAQAAAKDPRLAEEVPF